MKFVIVLLLLALVAFIAIKLKSSAPTKEGKASKGFFTKKAIATENEQGMYWRLAECFQPMRGIVLAQVSFGALLIAKGGASRYSFAQKMADFVLLNKSFEVVAVIELDDKSHKGKEDDDAARDAMLQNAGYTVLRYKQTPDAARLLADVKAIGIAF